MNIKVDFDNIVVKEDKNDFNVKVLMLKGEKGDAGEGENNVIEKVQVNGIDLPVTNKTVNVSVPIVDSTLSSSSTNPVQNKAVYDALGNKVDNSSLNNYYEISEVDELLNSKADTSILSSYYTKEQTYSQSETDALLNDKANTTTIDTINATLSNKANISDVENTYETKANHNADISLLSSQISGLASGSPLVASSISEMTDTSKVYVNTSDGKWYYYNGSDWIIGGVYQGTEASDNSVGYNNLALLLKQKNYDELHAEDILWLKGYTYANGSISMTNNNVSSLPFILPKGNTVTFNNSYKGRVTCYDLNGNYVSNTGTYKNFTYTATDDYIVIIGVQRPDNSTEIAESECNNTNITFTGIIKKEVNKLNKSISFHLLPNTSSYYSDPFYVTSGSEISISQDILKKDGNYLNGVIYFGVLEETINKDMSDISNYVRQGVYTTTRSGMVRLYIRGYAGLDLSNYLTKLNLNIYIKSNDYIQNRGLLYLYSSSDGAITIKAGTQGKLYINIATDITLAKENQAECVISMDNLETSFSENIETIDSVKYFFLNSNSMLYYDLIAKSLKIGSTSSRNYLYGDNIFPLIINRYANLCGGEILPLYLRYSYNKLQNIIDNMPSTTTNIRYEQDMFNSQPYGTYDWETKVKDFNKKYKTLSSNIDTFIFFTDPHIMGSSNTYSEDNLITYLNPLEKVYNSIPVEFIMCGGDWLNNKDTQDIACFKLGYIDGYMNAKFKNYYPMLGNHDTNYQGKLDDGSADNTGSLTDNTIINLLFSKFKKKYYSFNGINNINYVLDTGIDWGNTMSAYRWQQVDWLAGKLLEDDPIHATVFMHIVWLDSNHTVGCMVDPVTKLIDAFNNHTSITLNNVTYNFSSKTGHVDYVLSGHTHYDYNDTFNNVLCVATTNFTGSTGTYDIIINDYDNGKLIMYRVGTGESREFNI